MPYDDAQTRTPLDTCERCGGELWGDDADQDEHGRVYCPICRADMAEADHRRELAAELLETVDGVLSRYLSKDFRDTIYNEVAKRLKVA